MKRSGTKAKYSPMEPANVYSVQFTTMSQELLQRWSVAQIKSSKLYQTNIPQPGSPNDLRLGVSSQDQKCQTCGETKDCQGHFGHIRLNQPIFHYGYLKYLEKVLRCVCMRCGRLKNPQHYINNANRKWKLIDRIENPSKRLNQITKLLQNIKQCKAPEEKGQVQNQKKFQSYCNQAIPTKVTLKNYKFYAQNGNNQTIVLERIQIRNTLAKIGQNQESCRRLGFQSSKPIDLMIQYLAVPPPQIRPSIEMNPEKKAEDDITTAYVKIINLNNQLQAGQSLDKSSKIDELERTVASIMIKLNRAKMEKTNMNKKKVAKAYKSISDRLKGKEGRFRQNLMGKRVDFSARSVISGDSNLALDQLGVPQKIAERLTVPQQITKWNYNRIVKLCYQGKVKIVLKQPLDKLTDNQKPINITKMRGQTFQNFLNYGMVAERCLQDGDYVLFNRQPTLHRMSMMGHRVKILPFNTFRLNLSVCTPYNADFDGDQMNMHVPQTFQTISELKNIAHVPKQIIAPKNNAPVMGMVQDALLGVYLFTMRDTFLTRQQIMNLVIWIQGKQNTSSLEDLLPGQLPIPAILYPEPLWTGKQVMSMIIPRKISIEIKKGDNPLSNVKDMSMIIKKGQLITGALQKEVVGSGAGGLVHSIWIQISPDATNQFISVAQRIVNNWLTSNSFTVGASDIAPDQEFLKVIKKDKEDVNKLYYQIFNNYRDPELITTKTLHQKGKKIMDSFQFNINERLNSRLGNAQDGVKKYVSPYINNIFKMITAKSKGSQTNLAQIMFIVGNQNVDGKRCPLGFSKRALPHFLKDDNSPQPRGFVFSSFYGGLKPHQFFFHSMGGREGLSDTAVKTSRTGYIQRKLVKSLQDLVIRYDGTVRDSRNNYLQKMYGQDGFISEYIQKHKFAGAEMSLPEFEKNYRWKPEDLVQKYKYNSDQVFKIEQQYKRLVYFRRRMREIFINGKDNISAEYYCPINVGRLINKIKATNYSLDKEVVDPLYAYTQIQKLLNRCIPSPCIRKYQKLEQKLREIPAKHKKAEEKRQVLIREFEQDSGIQMFRIHILHHLASKKLVQSIKLSRAAFISLVEEIQFKFNQSLAPAGESIGSIAAQSIGEPTTQMTLNTFHLAGVSDKNVTLGVPRLQQLLDVSKNIKTPNMTIYLKTPIKQKDKAIQHNRQLILEILMYQLPERHLKDYIQASRFYYDDNYKDSKAGITYDVKADLPRLGVVLNLQFNMKKINLISLWQQLIDLLSNQLEGKFQIRKHVHFDEASSRRQVDVINPQLTLRMLQFNTIGKKQGVKETDTIFEKLYKWESYIKNINVGGIQGIKSVKTSKRFIMDAPEYEKTSLNQTQKLQYQYVVFETDGSNLRACLSHDLLDQTKTCCNDMTQIYGILGIEAARQSFINQFKEIIKPYGIYVNYRHLSILIDWMTMRGFITPVNRNGINRVKDVSVLRKASYEQTADILFGAAVFGERDYLRGISQKVIFGQPVEIGTSSFKIMIDTSQVANYKAMAAVDKLQFINPDENPVMSYRGYDFDDMNMGFSGDKTPISQTPNPYDFDDKSVLRSMRSPGLGGMSPSFTPFRDNNALFTPFHEFNGGISPLPHVGGRTPILPSYGAQPLGGKTPLYTLQNIAGMASPTVGLSSLGRFSQGSELRSPNYRGASSSSSPSYSDIRMTQSPNYVSPSSPSSSSPSYRGGDSNRQQNQKMKEPQEEEEQHDEF